MRNSFFLLLFCWFISSCGKDRGSHLLSGRSYTERFAVLDSLGRISNAVGYRVIDSIDKLSTDKFRNEETLQTALAALFYSPNRYDASSSKEAFLITALEKSKDKNWEKLYVESLQQMANYTWITIGDKNKALQYYNQAYLIYSHYTAETFRGKFLCLYEYGTSYYSFEDYDRCIALLTEAIKQGDHKIDKGIYTSTQNTLGLCYRAKGEYERSLEILNKALDYAKKIDLGVWITIIEGNIGTIYHFLNRSEEAKPLLQKEVDRGTTSNDWRSAMIAQTYLSEMDMNAGKVQQAKEGFLQARSYSLHIKREGNTKNLKRLYDDLALASRLNGNYQQALIYSDSAKSINDSIQLKFGANVFLSAQNQIDQATFAEKKKASESIHRYTRNLLIGGMVLLAIVSIFFITRLRSRYAKRQKKIQEEKERMERELQAATQELNQFARSIEEKNHIIERIEQLQTDKQDAEEKYEILSKLEKSVLLTDEQWNEFTGLFEKVYGSFLQRLKDKFPSISPAEMRIIALGKLKLSNKTMAGMLGITPDAVRMNKFRIRKKLNLEEESEFEKFLQTV